MYIVLNFNEHLDVHKKKIKKTLLIEIHVVRNWCLEMTSLQFYNAIIIFSINTK